MTNQIQTAKKTFLTRTPFSLALAAWRHPTIPCTVALATLCLAEAYYRHTLHDTLDQAPNVELPELHGRLASAAPHQTVKELPWSDWEGKTMVTSRYVLIIAHAHFDHADLAATDSSRRYRYHLTPISRPVHAFRSPDAKGEGETAASAANLRYTLLLETPLPTTSSGRVTVHFKSKLSKISLSSHGLEFVAEPSVLPLMARPFMDNGTNLWVYSAVQPAAEIEKTDPGSD